MNTSVSAMSETPITKAQQDVISDELDILSRVAEYLYHIAEAVPATGSTQLPMSYAQQMLTLRDQVGESRLEDVPALVAQMLHTAALMNSHKPIAQLAIDTTSPYFAHIGLIEKGKYRDVLIGKVSAIDRHTGVAIIDWRHAPISRLYYCYHQGDEYEEEFARKSHAGVIKKRRSVFIDKGALKKIRCPEGTFVLTGKDGEHPQWVAISEIAEPELKGGAGVAVRMGSGIHPSFRADKHLAEITALIDPAQFDAMTQSESGVVVLQGGAGSGKTTILLHRIAYLTYADPQRFRPKNMLVIVFSEALAGYVQQVLPSLGLHGVKVVDYRQWINQLLGQVISLRGRRRLDDAPSEVSALKKHPGMLKAIDIQVQKRRAEFEHALKESLATNDGIDDILDRWHAAIAHTSLAVALLNFSQALKKEPHLPSGTIERALKITDRFFAKITDLVTEWEELITDTQLLGECRKGPYPVLREEFISAIEWTKKQVEDPDQYAGVDADRKIAVDMRDIDADEPINALDPHDGPLLLNLYLARFGEIKTLTGKTIVYDHIAIDEAQDLSAVEIAPLYGSLQEKHSMTLAGDITQKVVFDNGFDNWSTLLTDMGAKGVELEPFRISYRSSVEITEFSQQILGPLAPKVTPKAVRRGAPVEVFEFDEIGEEIAFLADNLRNLMLHERDASVALLTRYPERADFFFEMLKRAEVPFLRRAQKSTFAFKPGIDVTHVAETKGLEYDYVILTEVNRAVYPDQIEARHLLHIGATRAAYQLWITTSSKNRSPILPEPK